MTQKELIEKAVSDFIELVDCNRVIAKLTEKREFLAPWVLKLLDRQFPDEVKVSSILYALFDDCVCEVGETIARKSTAVWVGEDGVQDPLGEVLKVAECLGHVWVSFDYSDSPLAHIEVSMYNNVRDEE